MRNIGCQAYEIVSQTNINENIGGIFLCYFNNKSKAIQANSVKTERAKLRV